MDTREIIRNRARELGKATFVSPDIPENKLRSAIRKIAGGGLPRESVVAVVDTSDTEDLSSGLLFAEDALYFTTSWSEPVCVPYEAIGRAEAIGIGLTALHIFREPVKGERRWRVEFGKGKFIPKFCPKRIINTLELCRIYAWRFSPDIAADILNTIVAAAKEDAGKTASLGDECGKEEELRAGYEREWTRLDRVGTLCLRIGIAMCCTLVLCLWGIPLIFVGMKLLRKRKEDANLPVLGLPLVFYEADTRELTAPIWWNILGGLGQGISAMCRKSQKRLEIMTAIVQDLNASPLETILRRYEEAFRSPETPLGIVWNRCLHPFRGLLGLYHGRLWYSMCVPFTYLLNKDAWTFNIYRFLWIARAKEDESRRAFVRAWLKHLERKGEIVCSDLDDRMFVFKPDCLRSVVARMEALSQSGERVSREEMTKGLKEVFPTDSRNVDAFVRSYGSGMGSYAFADGVYYVGGENKHRVRVCQVCGLAAMSGETDGTDNRDGAGNEYFCGDYCRETNNMCGTAKALLAPYEAGEAVRHTHRIGTVMSFIFSGTHSGATGKRIGTVGKGLGKFAGGKLGAMAGGSLLAFIPGGWLLGSLIGRIIGKNFGKQAVSAGIGALTDDGNEDAASSVAELVQEEFGILAAMYGTNGDKNACVLQKLEKLMAENEHFVMDVRSQGDNQRQYLARLMKPLFLEVCQNRIRPPSSEKETGQENSVQ